MGLGDNEKLKKGDPTLEPMPRNITTNPSKKVRLSEYILLAMSSAAYETLVGRMQRRPMTGPSRSLHVILDVLHLRLLS
jgi:hypothetical protein